MMCIKYTKVSSPVYTSYICLYFTVVFAISGYSLLMGSCFIILAFAIINRVRMIESSSFSGINDVSLCGRLLGSGLVIFISFCIQSATTLLIAAWPNIFEHYLRLITNVFKGSIFVVLCIVLFLYNKIISEAVLNHWRGWSTRLKQWDMRSSSSRKNRSRRASHRRYTTLEKDDFDRADKLFDQTLSQQLHVSQQFQSYMIRHGQRNMGHSFGGGRRRSRFGNESGTFSNYHGNFPGSYNFSSATNNNSSSHPHAPSNSRFVSPVHRATLASFPTKEHNDYGQHTMSHYASMMATIMDGDFDAEFGDEDEDEANMNHTSSINDFRVISIDEEDENEDSKEHKEEISNSPVFINHDDDDDQEIEKVSNDMLLPMAMVDTTSVSNINESTEYAMYGHGSQHHSATMQLQIVPDENIISYHDRFPVKSIMHSSNLNSSLYSICFFFCIFGYKCVVFKKTNSIE